MTLECTTISCNSTISQDQNNQCGKLREPGFGPENFAARPDDCGAADLGRAVAGDDDVHKGLPLKQRPTARVF